MFINNIDLLENHIYFLSRHRGKRESAENSELIHSEKSAFNIAFPFSSESIAAVSSFFRIYLPSWVPPNESLSRGWTKIGSITYMALHKHENNWKDNGALLVRKVTTLSDMEDFSLVQAKGFCEGLEEFNEWYPWMRKFNMENFNDSDQDFYVAYENEIPAGACLCIHHNGIAGIYAVTTIPSKRKCGISTTIMKCVVRDNIKIKALLITLQVSTDSYAHNFYRRLGFEDIFECEIFNDKH